MICAPTKLNRLLRMPICVHYLYMWLLDNNNCMYVCVCMFCANAVAVELSERERAVVLCRSRHTNKKHLTRSSYVHSSSRFQASCTHFSRFFSSSSRSCSLAFPLYIYTHTHIYIYR